METRLKAGIIGLGGMGLAGIERFRAHPRVDLTAAAEVNPERIAAAERKYGLPATYTDPLELATSWISHIKEDEVMETRILGTRGGLTQRWGKGEINSSRDGSHLDTTITKSPKTPYTLAYFADCILNDQPHMATGEEGLLVMEIIEALYLSARENRPVQILTDGTAQTTT